MPTVDDIAIAIARVYAGALLDSALSEGKADDLFDEMADLLAYTRKDPGFAGFLSSPAVDDDDRHAVLDRLFRGRMSDRLLNALQVMNDKRRIALFPQVVEEYRLALERHKGEVDVRVTTAVPFPARLRARLEEVLGALSGRQARVIEVVDETAIGGMVVQIEDEKFDATVRRHLRQLRDDLIDRASREIHGRKEYFQDVQT